MSQGYKHTTPIGVKNSRKFHGSASFLSRDGRSQLGNGHADNEARSFLVSRTRLALSRDGICGILTFLAIGGITFRDLS